MGVTGLASLIVLSAANLILLRYGRNPYVGYDNIDSSPFLYTGGRDPRLRPMGRVVTVSIGAAGVFSPAVDGRKLTFSVRGAQFTDDQTRSTWNVLGHAIAGPLSGRRLEPIVHGNHFWFSWASYRPRTRVWSP